MFLISIFIGLYLYAQIRWKVWVEGKRNKGPFGKARLRNFAYFEFSIWVFMRGMHCNGSAESSPWCLDADWDRWQRSIRLNRRRYTHSPLPEGENMKLPLLILLLEWMKRDESAYGVVMSLNMHWWFPGGSQAWRQVRTLTVPGTTEVICWCGSHPWCRYNDAAVGYSCCGYWGTEFSSANLGRLYPHLTAWSCRRLPRNSSGPGKPLETINVWAGVYNVRTSV